MDRLLTGGGGRDDLHVRLAPDDQRDALSHDAMVVDAEHADSMFSHLDTI
jgi:hypothetical protein